MRLDEQTPLVPERDWDELIATSMRRGRSLRRRRLALAASPLAAVLAVGIALPLSGVFGPGTDGLARLHTTNVGPTQSTGPTPGPDATASANPAPSGMPAPGTLPAPADTGSGHAARRVGPQSEGPTIVASAPSAVREAVRPVTVAYADAEGDATPDSAASSTTVSDPTLDIVHMSFTGDRTSLRITMELKSDYRTDGYYLAYFSDARTGCAYTVWVGGAYHDQLNWACGSETGAEYLQATPDSARALEAVVPLGSMPGGVKPRDTFTELSGQTRLIHPAGGQWPYDDATTSRSLRLP
jgi:hypothetical protein